MYEPDVDKHQAGLFGLAVNEIPVEEILIWDTNWSTFKLFYNLTTQWRVGGMGSATGLDYNAVPLTAKMLGIKSKRLKDMFPDLRVMENEALVTMRENEKDANDS